MVAEDFPLKSGRRLLIPVVDPFVEAWMTSDSVLYVELWGFPASRRLPGGGDLLDLEVEVSNDTRLSVLADLDLDLSFRIIAISCFKFSIFSSAFLSLSSYFSIMDFLLVSLLLLCCLK